MEDELQEFEKIMSKGRKDMKKIEEIEMKILK